MDVDSNRLLESARTNAFVMAKIVEEKTFILLIVPRGKQGSCIICSKHCYTCCVVCSKDSNPMEFVCSKDFETHSSKATTVLRVNIRNMRDLVIFIYL